jgi:hypothetical protein
MQKGDRQLPLCDKPYCNADYPGTTAAPKFNNALGHALALRSVHVPFLAALIERMTTHSVPLLIST